MNIPFQKLLQYVCTRNNIYRVRSKTHIYILFYISTLHTFASPYTLWWVAQGLLFPARLRRTNGVEMDLVGDLGAEALGLVLGLVSVC